MKLDKHSISGATLAVMAGIGVTALSFALAKRLRERAKDLSASDLFARAAEAAETLEERLLSLQPSLAGR